VTVYGKDPIKAMKIMRLLIQEGADINMTNKDNLTPLHVAVRRGNSKAVEHMLELSDEYRDSMPGFTPISIDQLGGHDLQSCLHLAALNRFQLIVEILVKHGANLQVRNKMG
jgi:ankyrin repeat protein